MERPDPYGEWVLQKVQQETGGNQAPIPEEVLAAARATWPRIVIHATREFERKGSNLEAVALAADIWEAVLRSVAKAFHRKGEFASTIEDFESYLLTAFHHRFHRFLKVEQERRESIVQLVYQGRGVPLESSMTPGNKIWGPSKMNAPLKSLDRARTLLRDAGFHWTDDGKLMDPSAAPVEFTIAVSSSSAERTKMATLIQDDLKQIGVRVQVVPLEFRALLSRVLDTKDYEACILGFADNDADPNSEMSVWLSSAPQHLWNPNQSKPATPWEAEIDQLMKAQLVARKPDERKRLYQHVLELSAENQPLIFLASPNILVGAKKNLVNFHPASLEHYTLWNADELFWRPK